ncbi:hypothetical protein V1511DRAFT_487765 [Dipodascopsis uninucleata]
MLPQRRPALVLGLSTFVLLACSNSKTEYLDLDLMAESTIFRVPRPLELSVEVRDTANMQRKALVLSADVEWQVKTPDCKTDFEWNNQWEMAMIVLSHATKVVFNVEIDTDMMGESIDLVETMATSVAASTFWSRVNLEPMLMIPDIKNKIKITSSKDGAWKSKFLLRFGASSMASSPLMNVGNASEIIVAYLQRLCFNIRIFWRGQTKGETKNKITTGNFEAFQLSDEILKLFDTALRILITSKLANRIPLLFCPGFADKYGSNKDTQQNMQSRYKLIQEVIVPSIGNIMRRRQQRLQNGEEFKKFDKTKTTRMFWEMATSLKKRLLNGLALDQFLNLEHQSEVFAHTNLMLSEKNSSDPIIFSNSDDSAEEILNEADSANEIDELLLLTSTDQIIETDDDSFEMTFDSKSDAYDYDHIFDICE